MTAYDDYRLAQIRMGQEDPFWEVQENEFVDLREVVAMTWRTPTFHNGIRMFSYNSEGPNSVCYVLRGISVPIEQEGYTKEQWLNLVRRWKAVRSIGM